MRRRAAVLAALTALGLWAGTALAQEKRPAPADRGVDKAGAAAPPLPDEFPPAIAAAVQVPLPLDLLRGAADMLEAALRQAEGAIVPIRPDAVLGREDDPLGKAAP